jgi:chemotaxis protein CheZ
MSNPADDFDALFDQAPEQRPEALASAPAARPLTSPKADVENSATLLESVQVLAPQSADESSKPMFERLGGIVRLLHDSLRELGYDRSLSHVAVQITDAQERLAYVATLTEQAANKVLNAIDVSIPEQERLSKQAGEMEARWAKVFDGKLDSDELKALAGDSKQFIATVLQTTDAEKARLLEIMMAQDFQDITGQLIKKIIGIVNTAEMELAKLLRDNAPAELKAALAAEELKATTAPTHGPSLPAAALAQDGVDDLLDSLGF